MPTGVELQFRKQTDHLAAVKKALIAALANRTQIWNLVDAAGDETYENRVKGTQITAVDNEIDAQTWGDAIPDWFTLHNTYFSTDVALTSIDNAIATYKWRVHQYFNELYYNWKGAYLTLDLGTYAFTGSTFTDGSAVDITKSGLGKLMAVSNAIGATNAFAITVTVKLRDDTTKTISVSFPANTANNTEKVLGEQSLSANANKDQAIISVAATDQFKIGERVLIEDTSEQEWGVISSIIANTSITLTANLKHNYTTAASAKVTPLFKDVTACSHSSGNAGDQVSFKVKGDRTVSITAS